MSYPLHKVPGGSAARTVRTETGFWGLDLSMGASDGSFSRASDTENLIWKEEALAVRPGYRQIAALSGRINGFFPYEDCLVVHAGTRLYQVKEGEEPIVLYEAMADAPSHGVVRHQTLTRRRCLTPFSCQWVHENITGDFLFIHDGAHYLFYDGIRVRSVADSIWNADLFALHAEGIYPEFFATVPFTAVAKRPDSGGDVDPRGDNRLSQFRCESFCISGEEDVKSFRLNCLVSDYNDNMAPEVQLRDIEGIWRCLAGIDIKMVAERESQLARIEMSSIRAGTSFKLSNIGVIVGFGTGDYVFADDGMDNVRITYGVLKEEPEALNGATAFGLYGADGADDVLFLGGSAIAPGEDAFSAPNDFFCFYSTAVERLGGDKTPVTGYCRLSDGRLAVLKNDPNGSTVFFRDHQLVEFGQTQSGERYRVDAYPSKTGAAVEGCLSPHALGIAGNEPCFLAKSGLYGVRSVSDELTNLNETVRRSMPIDALLTRLDPQKARAIRWNNYFLLAFEDTVFLTDGRRDNQGQLRFLKWSLAHKITALGKKDGDLYLGDAEGRLFHFGESTDDAGTPIRAFWKTPIIEDKSGRKMLLRRLWAAVEPGEDTELSVRLYRDHTPMKPKTLDLHCLDFAALDFGNFSFEGCRGMRWVPLCREALSAHHLSTVVDLSHAGTLTLWGFRMIYEKGGMMR